MSAPIVVATDFSDGAAAAVECAAALASRMHVPLHVLHVFNDGIWATLEGLYNTAHWQGADPVLATRHQLSALVADLAQRHGIQALAESSAGSAADEIAAFVGSCGAGLLVIGKQGEHWVADALVGETALKLSRQVEVPVLVACDRQGREMNRLLIATDFTDAALRAAQQATQLFPTAQTRLLNAFVVQFESRMRLAGATEEDISRYRRIERERAEDGMRSFVAQLADAREIETIVTLGFPAAAILETAAHDVDLIVVGRHGGSTVEERLLGSVARNVLYHAGCNVMLVP